MHNLPELEHTNGIVLRNLLKPENDTYEALCADATGVILLEQILTADSAGQRVNVLLDAGALVIDMSNEAIAWKWLQAPLKDGVPNECNWKLRHYKHGE